MNYSVALVQLPLVRESGEERVTSPTDAQRVCGDMAGLAQECFHVLCLNVRHRLINRHMIGVGIVDSCLMHPREVFRAAVLDGASDLILIHNHPSGDATPSAEDLRITRQMVKAGKIMGINVLDHVIIGRAAAKSNDRPARPSFISMREAGLCAFE